MDRITGGDWYVPYALEGDEADANGRIVVTGPEGAGTVVADCRNDYLPYTEQLANCRAVAAVPRMLLALSMAESMIGDLPATPTRKTVHAAIVRALILSGQLPDRPRK